MKILKLVLLAFFYCTSAIASNDHHYMSTSIGGGAGIFGSIFSFSTGSQSHRSPPAPSPGFDYLKETVSEKDLLGENARVMNLQYRLYQLQQSNQSYIAQAKRETHEIKNYQNQAQQSFDQKESWQDRYTQRMQEPELLQKAQQSFETKLETYKSTHGSDFLPNAEMSYIHSQSNFKYGHYQEAHFYLELARDLLDVASSVTPGVCLGRDSYEAYTGKNLITGETLSHFERAIAVVGVVTAGNSNIGVKGVSAINKITGVNLPKEVMTISKDIIERYGIEGYKEVVKLLKTHTPSMPHDLFRDKRRAVLAAFSRLTEFVKKSPQDVTLYRYIDTAYVQYLENGAHWLTSHKYDTISDVMSNLALRDPVQNMTRAEFTVQKGSAYLRGGVAPKFGQPGGGEQFYVFDKTNAKLNKQSQFNMKD